MSFFLRGGDGAFLRGGSSRLPEVPCDPVVGLGVVVLHRGPVGAEGQVGGLGARPGGQRGESGVGAAVTGVSAR